MTYDQIVGLIQSVGFPITMSVWFMLRLEKRYERLIAQQAQLVYVVSALAQAWDVHVPVLATESQEDP